jgi:hypothetical protein
MIKAVKDKNIAALRRLLDNGKHPDSETDAVSKELQIDREFHAHCTIHGIVCSSCCSSFFDLSLAFFSFPYRFPPLNPLITLSASSTIEINC